MVAGDVGARSQPMGAKEVSPAVRWNRCLYPGYAERARTNRWLAGLAWMVPLHTSIPFLLELEMAFVRLGGALVKRRFRNACGLRVQLGCGQNGKPGWVNLDRRRYPGVNCVYDCRRSLPFPDGSVQALYAEHFLEHLDYTEEVPEFLMECARVLAPEGTLRLVVPDMGAYLRAYSLPVDEAWERFRQLRPLGAGGLDPAYECHYRTRMELINTVISQGHQHRFAYDYEQLHYVLSQYPFRDIEQSTFAISRSAALANMDSLKRASESLYVEATRA